MAETKTLAASVRSGTGKGAARSVRREGRIPAVIYGGGDAPQPISLDRKTATQIIHAGRFLTTIFEIDVDGKKERAIPRDYQLDPVKDTVMHVDFLRLKPGSRLRVEVPVHFINVDTAPGIKRGGSVNVVRHTVEMFVPADNIPEFLTADLAGFDFNDSLHISAIALPEGCKPTITDRDLPSPRSPRRSSRRKRLRPLRPPPLRLPPRPLRPRTKRRSKPDRLPPLQARRDRDSGFAGLFIVIGRRSRLSRGFPCFSSSGSAIPAANMPAIAITSASWRSSRSRARTISRRSARAFRAA